MKAHFDHHRRSNIILVLLSSLICIIIGEIVFRCLIVHTTGIEVTLVNQRWLQKYWNPINSLGLRDVEYTDEYLDGKRHIFVVGDSFVAGVGIRDIEDRMGNTIGRLLGNSFAVLNIADRGWNTPEEIQALETLAVRPDAVVLVYYLNDIEGAAHKYDIYSAAVDDVYRASSDNGFFHSMRRSSYLIDYFYWRMYPLSTEGNTDWWNWVRSLYKNQMVWNEHQFELEAIIQYCRRQNARLYVVIFPNLIDIPGSMETTTRVHGFFTRRRIPTLHLAPLLLRVPRSKLVVNSSDAHPGPWLHAFVAEKVSLMIQNDLHTPVP